MEHDYVTFVKTSSGLAVPVTQIYVQQLRGITNEVVEMYEKDSSNPDGYTIAFLPPFLPVDVIITSLTQSACVDQEILCVASSPGGVLTYDFQIEFAIENWLSIQNSESPTWDNVETFGGAGALQGFKYRCVVTASDGNATDSQSITGGRLQPACAAGSDDWDTWQLGAGMIPSFSTSSNDITFNSAYPNVTGSDQFNADNTGSGSSPYQYVPRSRYAAAADKPLMAPYAAIYITAAEAASGDRSASDVEGWYVFGPGVDTTPGENGYIEYSTPVAWPAIANNNDGYISVNAGFTSPVVWLSQYDGGTGSGGTANWSEPTDLLS